MTEIKTLVLGSILTNCYVVIRDDAMVVIDPATHGRKLTGLLEQQTGKKLLAVLLTHGHFDHIGGADYLAQHYHCPVYLAAEDEYLATHEEVNSMAGLSAIVTTKTIPYPAKELKLGPFDFEVFVTPGHTDGSVCLRLDDALFTGDTLFRRSVGRTDLYSGSSSKLLRSLGELSRLDPELKIYPGHDGPSVLKEELLYNPYM